MEKDEPILLVFHHPFPLQSVCCISFICLNVLLLIVPEGQTNTYQLYAVWSGSSCSKIYIFFHEKVKSLIWWIRFAEVFFYKQGALVQIFSSSISRRVDARTESSARLEGEQSKKWWRKWWEGIEREKERERESWRGTDGDDGGGSDEERRINILCPVMFWRDTFYIIFECRATPQPWEMGWQGVARRATNKTRWGGGVGTERGRREKEEMKGKKTWRREEESDTGGGRKEKKLIWQVEEEERW